MINFRKFFVKEQLETKKEDIEQELEKQKIRGSDKYKWCMKCSIEELNSIIIYNFPYITEPRFKDSMSTEELEEINTLIKTARVAMEDQKEQLYGKDSCESKKR